MTTFCSLQVLPVLAQQPEKQPVPLDYAEVIEISGVHQDELYARAQVWFASAFVDSKGVLKVQDKAEGLLVGKGSMPYEPTKLTQARLCGEVLYTLKIAIKDGRYRYELGPFRHHASGVFPGLGWKCDVDFGLLTTSDQPPEIKILYRKSKQKAWDEMKEMVKELATKLIASLKAGMQKNSKGAEDW